MNMITPEGKQRVKSSDIQTESYTFNDSLSQWQLLNRAPPDGHSGRD